GELGVRLTLGEWMDEDKAAKAAEHWAGDRQTIATDGNKAAIAWHVRYDYGSEADAGRWAALAVRAIFPVLVSKLGKPATQTKDFICFERADRGPLAIETKYREVVWILGPTSTDPSGAWKSAGDCKLAKKWADEVISQK
ncbi:MAG: hypothetical protein ACRELY_05180, partial [Polyangiaceae bacterium]